MSDKEAFEKLQKYIPPWIVFDDERSEYKLSDKALNSEENHEIKNSYNREWWIFQSAVDHCKQGEPASLDTFIGEVSQNIAELPDRNSPDDWPEAMLVTHDELKEIITGVHETFPLFTHAIPKSDDKQWQYLPVNPTDEMMTALVGNVSEHPPRNLEGWINTYRKRYAEMLKVAPQPSTYVSELDIIPGLVDALSWSLSCINFDDDDSDMQIAIDKRDSSLDLIHRAKSIIAKHTVK